MTSDTSFSVDRSILPDGVQLRPFEPGDYEAFAALHALLFPEHPFTPDEWRITDEQSARDGRVRFGRLLAVRGGELVGYGEYTQNIGMYHPRRFLLQGGVRPEWQGQGVGRALYDELMARLAPMDPLSVRIRAREDHVRALRFLSDRGFVETQRTWESTVDPRTLDLTPYDEVLERVRAQGVEIVTAAQMQDRPDWREQLYGAFAEARLDTPRSEPASHISFEQFQEYVLDDPMCLLDAYFVALVDGEAVGTSDLYRSGSTDGLFTGFTGVRAAWRGRGVALALKVHALRYAQTQGVPWVRTDNASTNAPMLAVNEKFGFVREPAWLSLNRVLAQE